MYHITIRPDTFKITNELKNQNPFIDVETKVTKTKALEQHKELTAALKQNLNYVIQKKTNIPDITFTANMGLSLPRLPVPIIIVSSMKYPQRQNERVYIEEILADCRIKTIRFPEEAVFEGQAEAKWFDQGQLLVVGYGHRATEKSVRTLRSLLKSVYEGYGVEPPRIVSFHLQNPHFYHLDLALLEIGQLECIVQKEAFTPSDLLRLKSELRVSVIDSPDYFCLNSFIEGDSLLTHELSDPAIRTKLEALTGKTVVEFDTSEFEKSGGSVRCLVFDVYDPRMVKKKRSSTNLSSPKSPKMA
jgi:N-dimethylarginine dimethylaminohydrolase